MQALLTAIVTWLSINFGLPAAYDLPNVRFAAPAEIADLRYGAITPKDKVRVRVALASQTGATRRHVLSVYDGIRRTIVLPNGWTGRTPAELSILVHEMVHHLQAKAKISLRLP